MALFNRPAGIPQLASTRQPNQSAVRFGLVYLPKKTLLRQVYRKYWCELHRESSFYQRQLVLYELSEGRAKGSHSDDVASQLIPLDKTFKVSMKSTNAIKGKYVFEIVTAKHQYLIAVNTLSDASSWVKAINDEFFGPPVPGVVYEYRVAVSDYKRRGTRCNNYVLRVYDDEIKLFTANGKIAMDVSYKIKDIYNIKCQPAKKQYKSGCKSSLTFSIKNTETCYQEKDVLSLYANSKADLVRVIYHRKRLVTQGSSQAALNRDGSMSRAKSMDVLCQTQKESPPDLYTSNKEGIKTNLSLVDHFPLSSQLHSQADHSTTSYQNKRLPRHHLYPSEVNETDSTSARKRSKSHEPVLSHDQVPVLPSCKIVHDSRQHCTGHCRSNSLQDFSLAKNSCDSLTQQNCKEDCSVSPLVRNSFKMSDLLTSKAESVPEHLHQEEQPTMTDDSSRCRFESSSSDAYVINSLDQYITILPDVPANYETINHYECIDDDAYYEPIVYNQSNSYEDIDSLYHSGNCDSIYSIVCV